MGLRKYETMIVLRDGMGDETEKLTERLEETITKVGGKIAELETWGSRKLAYLLKKQSTGHYVLFRYGGPPEMIKEFERTMKLHDDVLKFITILLEENLSVEEFNSIEKVAKKSSFAEQQDDERFRDHRSGGDRRDYRRDRRDSYGGRNDDDRNGKPEFRKDDSTDETPVETKPESVASNNEPDKVEPSEAPEVSEAPEETKAPEGNEEVNEDKGEE